MVGMRQSTVRRFIRRFKETETTSQRRLLEMIKCYINSVLLIPWRQWWFAKRHDGVWNSFKQHFNKKTSH